MASDVNGVGDIDPLVKRLFLSRRASAAEDVNLTFVRDRLLKSDLDKDRLFGLYQTIHAGKRAVADDPRDPYCNALRLSGIVAERDGFLFVRNRVYRELFSPEWAQEQMPGIEAARQRREVRRARLQIGSVAAAIVLALSALTGLAWWNADRANNNARQLRIVLTDAKNARKQADLSAQQARDKAEESARQKEIADKQKTEADTQRGQAEQQKKAADKSRLEAIENADMRGKEEKKARKSAIAARQEATYAQHLLYIANMNLVQREYEANHISNTLALLEETRHSASRGFEWGYWNRLCHLDISTRKIGSGYFSSDGKRIVVIGGNAANVWDVAAGKEVITLKGHTISIESAAFSSDDKWIVTGSYDNTAKVWNAQTGKELLTHGSLIF